MKTLADAGVKLQRAQELTRRADPRTVRHRRGDPAIERGAGEVRRGPARAGARGARAGAGESQQDGDRLADRRHRDREERRRRADRRRESPGADALRARGRSHADAAPRERRRSGPRTHPRRAARAIHRGRLPARHVHRRRAPGPPEPDRRIERGHVCRDHQRAQPGAEAETRHDRQPLRRGRAPRPCAARSRSRAVPAVVEVQAALGVTALRRRAASSGSRWAIGSGPSACRPASATGR